MRKIKEITLDDNNNNLVFVIEQMPATKMQKWCLKALTLLCGTEMTSLDLSALQAEVKSKGLSLLQGLDIDKAEPLINDLYTCVKHKTGNAQTQVTSQNIDAIITDMRTLFKLQIEVLKHNFDFLTESPLTSDAQQAGAEQANRFNMRMSL